MNFHPYHGFVGCATVERRIRALSAAGTVRAEILAGHEAYHYSLVHKVRSARYHVEALSGYLSSQAALSADPADLVYRVNFHFDGFLYVLGSARDIFAREILTYFGIPLPAKVYFRTAEELIQLNRPGDPILPLIARPSWAPEFMDYRNTATHENVIGTQYTIQVAVLGGNTTRRLVVQVPDDPRSAQRTFRRNPDIVVYCTTTFKRVLSQFNKAYAHMAMRMNTAGRLPI